MADYKKIVLDYLDKKNIKYTVKDEHTVRIGFSGDNKDTIAQYLFFDEDGDPLMQTRCWEIASFKGEKHAKGVELCNELNRQYRWVHFSLDGDDDLNVSADCFLTKESAGPVVHHIVHQMVNIIDDAYPRIMKTLWG